LQSSAAAEVVEAVQRSIRDGTYKAGGRLPSERAISDQLQVSRPTVREAIGALIAVGIVESRRGSGVYVAPPVPGELLRPLQFALELSDPTLLSLFEVRLALEPLAAGLAAERHGPADLEHMRRCVGLAAGERVSKQRFVELDSQLHMLIVEASRNSLLHNLVASLSWLSLQSRERTVREPGLQGASVRDHEAIVDAIASRNRIDAETAMRHHLQRVWDASRRIDGSARTSMEPPARGLPE
jgi:GntR family transcriptional repressor for pyruvate dehydrogenase complex